MYKVVNLHSRNAKILNVSMFISIGVWIISQLISNNYVFNLVFTAFFVFLGILSLYLIYSSAQSKNIWYFGVVLFGLSMFFWSIGELLWFYYADILKLTNFYPSIADVFYTLTYPLMFTALIYFSFCLKGITEKTSDTFKLISSFVLLMTLVLLLFIFFDRSGSFFSNITALQSFFDTIFLVGDALLLVGNIVILGHLLLFHWKSVDLVSSISISSIGVFLLFLGDIMFSYSIGIGTYVEGNFVDLLYLLSAYFVTTGILRFLSKLEN